MNPDTTLLEDNEKLVSRFGAQRISDLKEIPDCYTFKRDMTYSHRDFDVFLDALKRGEPCAIVSGFNASGTIHIGHRAVFDTNLYFQREFGVRVFIPISDDESYITGKVETQEEGLSHALALARELLAYGFDPHKTYFIIDQIYTTIYNLAIKLSRRVTVSELKATYGYKDGDNPGLYFYPTVQSAHILLPQEQFGIKHVLVPIGPDEDSHIRICRDLAARAGYQKPSILHVRSLPGLDGTKMSKSKNNAIFLKEDETSIRKKVQRVLSGGATTKEEHLRTGGDPDTDISCLYLSKLFLDKRDSERLFSDYRAGKILSGEVKQLLAEHLVRFTSEFQNKLRKITDKDLDIGILRNEVHL